MNWKLTAIAMAAVLLGACGGGGPAPDPGQQPAALEGTVAITGAPLADLDNPAVVGEQDSEKWSVRIIDPTEDVDLINVDHDDDTLYAVDLDLSGDYILQVDVLPAVDLGGGSLDTTPVSVSVPVTLITDATTTVDVQIEFVAPTVSSAVHMVSQDGEGYLIRLRFQLAGPAAVSELIELRWQDHLLRRDTNGDGQLDDETEYLDSDRDGISDALINWLRQSGPGGAPQTVTGTVTGLQLQSGWLRVDEQPVQVHEGTLIRRGMHRLRLVELELGDHVSVTVTRGSDNRLYAQEIHVQGH